MERHDEQQQEKPHKRRIHYSGRYPRHFAEKYKELNPEKYGEEIAHVRAKGNTPAGTHIPIMVKEILEVLAIKPGERGFDATLGYGGHTLAMLEKLEGKGHLYGGDVDPIESEKTEARIRAKGFGPDIWERRQMNFCEIDKLAEEVGPFDFVLADLGVSSMQIDNPERGFTYKSDGPLDLRLNPQAGISAADRLRQLDYEELVGMMQENADEPYAEAIARQIIRAEKHRPIRTTRELYAVIEAALEKVRLPRDAAGKMPDRRDIIRKSSARLPGLAHRRQPRVRSPLRIHGEASVCAGTGRPRRHPDVPLRRGPHRQESVQGVPSAGHLSGYRARGHPPEPRGVLREQPRTLDEAALGHPRRLRCL